jgi:hypothetical protein
MHVILRAVVLPLVFAASVAAPIGAQEVPSRTPRLSGMFTVFVLDRSGAETEGSLVSLTDSVLVVRTGAADRTFELDDVVRIYRKGDSLKNGAIIGALFGTATGLALAGGCSSGPGCGAGTRTAAVFTSIAVWAAVGASLDALIAGRTLIWTRNPAASTGGLTVVLSPERRSAFLGWTIVSGRQAQEGRP